MRYEFDDYSLDVTRQELRRGTDLVAVEPQVLDLLHYLIRNRERVVSKDDLIANVWNGRLVSDSALTSRIATARQVVGDSGQNQRLIRTLARKGVRFVGEVRESQISDAAAATVDTPSPALTLPDRPSVAVLPFTNMSGDPDQEYFADGIAEDIITELSRFGGLFVIARNSSFQWKGKLTDVRSVGRDLGVRYVLEGSVRKAADRIRISAQLIDAASGGHLWAEHYDRDMQDVFAVQDEVASTVAAILAAHVSKAEAERTLLKPPASWQAYDFYMRALAAYSAFHRPMEVAAIYETRRLLEHCITIDPGFARAYVLYSAAQISTWALALDGDHQNPAALENARQSAEKAIQLDPTLPQSHAQLGYVLGFSARPDAAVAEFKRAIALNPNFTDWRYAAVLTFAGHAERAIAAAKAYLRVDPFALPIARGYLGLAYLMARRHAEAVPPIREFISQSPNHFYARAWLAAAYGHLGQLEDARAQAAQLLRLDPTFVSNRARDRQFVNYFRPQDAAHILEGLRKAGLPPT
jgi:adenylate cyclase